MWCTTCSREWQQPSCSSGSMSRIDLLISASGGRWNAMCMILFCHMVIMRHTLQMNQCDERLTRIQVPHDFNRAVKGLNHVKHWKDVYIGCRKVCQITAPQSMHYLLWLSTYTFTCTCGYDNLFEIRPLIDQLLDLCTKYYNLLRELSIDEMIIGTRCWILFLQYLPKLPTKFGIKVWVLSESKSGYVLKFCTGKKEEVADASKSLGHRHRVVLELTDGFCSKGHKVLMLWK